jgi:iron complex outermembrane receptor protein
MQSKQSPVLRMSVIAVAAHLTALAAGTAFAQEAATATPGKAEVVITGKKLGMGLMVTEDAPKARSTITAEELEKQRPTGNAYEALEMLPAVNSYNYDATGLFGGGLTLRGFNSDQIGATINGVPVNDSGSYSVYPQEYVDQENTCQQFVTQGSTDVDSPQVGASGGNFGIVTCDPEDKQRFRAMLTLGQLSMSKTFLRYDTGLFGENQRQKVFVSASHAETEKWKGKGRGMRDHIDAAYNYTWDRFNYIKATILYNDASNNNFLSATKADFAKNGYYYDYSDTFNGHLTPVAGTAQKETANSPAYYNLSKNPFKNAIASATAKFRLTDNLDIKVVPYYWYGFGTGGTQQRALAESGTFLNPATGKVTASKDLNGDGDTLDTVIVANSSVTKTNRPGVTASATYSYGDHTILGGFWFERATHRQTGPAVGVNADGTMVDEYLQDGQLLRSDGTPFESRNWKTISTGYQGFLQDTFVTLDDKLTINVGVSTRFSKRDFTNYATEASPVAYTFKRTDHKVLPQAGIRYRLTADDQLFASIAQNFKAPANFTFAPTSGNVTVVNGVAQYTVPVNPETSTNLDIGYRHQTKAIVSSITFYNVNFKDRLATAYDPNTATSVVANVGKVTNQGIELELGNTPINGWAAYVSYGYSKSEIKSKFLANVATVNGVKTPYYLDTMGKEFPLTPRQKAAISLEYSDGPFYARVKARATSKQQATLMNDEVASGYTTYGFDAGYTFANQGWLKRPKLSLNISNLTNKQYLNPASQSVTNALAYTGVTAKTVSYYAAAPRFSSVTFSADF